jgi:hypothetical protein
MMPMLQDPIEGTRHFARFTLPNGDTVDGEFLLDGPQTGVILYVDGLYSPRSVDFATLHADLPAHRCLSFLKCIALSGDASHSGTGRQIQRLHLFPHFAILGSRTFSPDARIRRLGVVPDDFASIYYDFDAFGFDLAPEEHIGRILETFEARIGRRVDPGDRPIIAYFTGRRSLFSANTAFGRVSARHLADRPITGGGPRGVTIYNAVMTDLDFDPPVTFDQAIDNLGSVLGFLELIAGRRQNLLRTELELDLPENGPGSIFKVYWSSPPSRPTVADERSPHPADLPLNGGVQPLEFAEILERWLAADYKRRDAREQFSGGFSKGNLYDVDRLVSSANMFDILPASAAPKDVELTDDLRKAKAKAQEIFGALPQSIERDSVLSALGRIGTASLKHKVGHRGKIVLAEAGERFPDLILVLEKAVNCRNHYVHGSSAKIDYRGHFFETVSFFAQTLEFVFAASDLIEAGWKIGPWLQQGTSMSHPFGTYRVAHRDSLQALKTLLATAAKEAPES